MKKDDIPAVLDVMAPFIKNKVLLPRDETYLLKNLRCFIVYELDGVIMGCSSLIPYEDGQMEIAALTVDAAFVHMGIGQKMIEFLVERARARGAKSVFLLTTQPTPWFENLGFALSGISTLPSKRRAIWDPVRASKVLRYTKL